MLQGYLSPQRQAHIFATGLLTLLTLGTLSLIAACLAAIWLFIQICALILQSSIECLNAISTTYEHADATIRLLVLCALAYLVYRLVARLRSSSRRP